METNCSFLRQQNQYKQTYFTQGTNESNTAFDIRNNWYKLTTDPDSILRIMVGRTIDEKSGSFGENCRSFSTSPSEEPIDRNQYFIKLTPDTLKQGSSQNIGCTPKALSVPLETQNCHRETGDKPKKTVFQRLLNFLTRCFTPCINLKP